MREEADILNYLWDFAVKRLLLTEHVYYLILAKDMQAVVRSYK